MKPVCSSLAVTEMLMSWPSLSASASESDDLVEDAGHQRLIGSLKTMPARRMLAAKKSEPNWSTSWSVMPE